MQRRGDANDETRIPAEDDPDYPLSEDAGYAGWEPPERPWLRPLLIAISLLLLVAFIAPLLLQVVG